MTSVICALSAASPDRGAVVIFPHAGGSPRFYHHWRAAFHGESLLGVVYPGRDQRIEDPLPESMSALADSIAAELRERNVDVLFGHSLGALVAYEVARRLAREGRTPMLVVSGRDAPTSDGPLPSQLHRGSDADLVADLVRLDQRNAEVFGVPELHTLFLPIVRADYRLAETYRPPTQDAVLPAIAVVNGVDDHDVSHEGSQAWSAYAEQFLGVHHVPGGHFHHAAPSTDCAQFVARMLRVRRAEATSLLRGKMR